MKYISEFKPGEFWESSDQRHWKRLDKKYEDLIQSTTDIRRSYEILAKYIMENPEIPEWEEPEGLPTPRMSRQELLEFNKKWNRDIAKLEKSLSEVPTYEVEEG